VIEVNAFTVGEGDEVIPHCLDGRGIGGGSLAFLDSAGELLYGLLEVREPVAGNHDAAVEFSFHFVEFSFHFLAPE
jgi:hypothetical protein